MNSKESPDKLNVLVVGSGGREHAICWKIAQSPLLKHLYCAPGNGGTALMERCSNEPIPATDFDKIADFAKANSVDLVVIGPDNQLADGITDFLSAKGLKVFGPTRESAKLEWSKAYAKTFMQDLGLPTARFALCQSLDNATKTVKENPWARVVKVDGLALGKGVYVADSEQEALEALEEIFTSKKFGSAGEAVVIEERLNGEELSLLLFCDGEKFVEMPGCQDHKRRLDGDLGPNTGGMGVYCPVPVWDEVKDVVRRDILAPLSAALKAGRFSYKGVLYLGLMIARTQPAATTKTSTDSNTSDGVAQPFVLEFNSRFGDPETQAILPLMESDLLAVLLDATAGTLDPDSVRWSSKSSMTVVACAKSYPESGSRGEEISISDVPQQACVFHAGTSLSEQGLSTNGGRVLAVTGLGDTLADAKRAAYQAIESVHFGSMDYRRDIGWRTLSKCLSNSPA